MKPTRTVPAGGKEVGAEAVGGGDVAGTASQEGGSGGGGGGRAGAGSGTGAGGATASGGGAWAKAAAGATATRRASKGHGGLAGRRVILESF
jgi:hypothetical protein